LGGSSPSISRRSIWSPPAFSVLGVQCYDESTGRRSAKYFVDKNSNLAGLSWEELEMELQNKNDLLPKIVRMGFSLSGTRPFWKSKLNGLEAQARFLDSSPVFLTFSCADMQWDMMSTLPEMIPFGRTFKISPTLLLTGCILESRPSWTLLYSHT
jgi:Helitron helicase-like domain at N-terminus